VRNVNTQEDSAEPFNKQLHPQQQAEEKTMPLRRNLCPRNSQPLPTEASHAGTTTQPLPFEESEDIFFFTWVALQMLITMAMCTKWLWAGNFKELKSATMA